MTDPFKARSKGSTRAPTPADRGEPSRAELEDLRKTELIELARERGLDTDGTKAELVDRLAP